MGRVWPAEDQLLRRPVSVKEMLGAVADQVDIHGVRFGRPAPRRASTIRPW